MISEKEIQEEPELVKSAKKKPASINIKKVSISSFSFDIKFKNLQQLEQLLTQRWSGARYEIGLGCELVASRSS